jgi:hypothetical protein
MYWTEFYSKYKYMMHTKHQLADLKFWLRCSSNVPEGWVWVRQGKNKLHRENIPEIISFINEKYSLLILGYYFIPKNCCGV